MRVEVMPPSFYILYLALNSPLNQEKSYHLVALVDNKNPSVIPAGGSFLFLSFPIQLTTLTKLMM